MPYQYTHALVVVGPAETTVKTGEEKVCAELLGIDVGPTNRQVVIDCVGVATGSKVKALIKMRVRRGGVAGAIIGRCEVITASVEAKNTMVVMGVDNLPEVANEKYVVTIEVTGEENEAAVVSPVLQAQW